ncbi:TonB-dependent receptor [Sphingomonas antarctica]|uniref:TonB-dependent receptor n=1 Tax=Sphingomonas antarctica TaxID=2040274 RepID=UPI0039EA0677
MSVTKVTLAATLLASVAIPTTVMAQNAASAPASYEGESEIIVTAQKREESLQSVPISIQALSTKKLDQLGISNFNEYAQQLPSVSFQTSAPGVTNVYMRGVASGGDGNHSGSLPSVGVYLDEQPVTTIGGTLDVHVYDIARIESLAGPQGTLYGASSEAGTIRIITNKPVLDQVEGRVDGEVNSVHSGGVGGKLEGVINLPLWDAAALRVVGYYQHDTGFIDNVAGTRAFLPQPGGITVNNNALVKKNFNDTDTWGGRAALKIDLDDNWTVTPTILYQDQRTHGVYGYDPSVGDLKVQHFFPDYGKDRYLQGALTIEGKLGNWDLTYAGAYLDRKRSSSSDYTDYAETYDSLYSSVGGVAGYFYFQNAAGQTIDSRQRVFGSDHFKKTSQEFRVASPQDERFRVVAGLFYQNQSNLIHQDYFVPNLAANLSVNGHPGTLWLTQQKRVDKDYAAFGEASFDIVPTLTLTGGARGYIYDNSLIGFFGFGRDPNGPPYNAAGSSRTGVAGCFNTDGSTVRDNPGGTLIGAAVPGGPCTNLGTFVGNGKIVPKETQGQGFLHKLNLTWKPSRDLLLYGTWSRGYRPGGINRRGTVAPYAADFLTNYEVGVKTTWLDGKLRINGAVYQQDWKNFQFAFLGANSFTEIHNGPNARIRGVEADAALNLGGLSLTAAGSYTDAKTRNNLCAQNDTTCTVYPTLGSAATGADFIASLAGRRLPITPKFKVSGTARYGFPLGGDMKGHVQANVVHQSSATSDVRDRAVQTGTGTIYSPADQLGRLPAYTLTDFTAGVDFGANSQFSIEAFLNNAFDERAQITRFSECGSCLRTYIVPFTPRTFGLRGGVKF